MADEFPGTAGTDEPADLPQGDAEGEPEAGATASEPTEPDYTDPAKLPPELQGLGKRLQASYTKRMQQLARERDATRQDRELVERYRTDPAFRRQFLETEARANGLLGTPANAVGGQGQAPTELVDAIKAQLAPELQWLAPQIAAGQHVAFQKMVAPLLERQDQDRKAQQTAEWDTIVAQMSEKYPGWEARAADIAELAEFFSKPGLQHRKFGSKPELLYRLVTGDAGATATAARRIGETVRQRMTTGQATRQAAPNIAQKVRAASTSREALEIAAAAAIDEAKRNGVLIPED